MKKIKFGIALGYSGKLMKDIYKSWSILRKKFNVKYIGVERLPHITLFSGDIYLKNQELIYKKLKKCSFKKFKLRSPGLGIFATDKPNLFIRWERNKNLIDIREHIKTKISKNFINVSLFCEDKIWEPRSVIAWQDLKYQDLFKIKKSLNFLFKNHNVNVDSFLLTDHTVKEKIIHKINFK
tara:strand:+ start:1092 stop:1634 length:543 start_codon:yes stop_codon:yes gene_type:complete